MRCHADWGVLSRTGQIQCESDTISEQHHPFYRPLWRRVAIVAAVALWLAFETFYSRDPLWISAAAAMLAYGVWTFFLKWPKTPDDPPK